MKRSIGVTVITILSLIGSALTFALGIVMLVVMVLAPASSSNQFPGSPLLFKMVLLFSSLVYLLPAVWGIVTGIGLWRLKNWARISIIVFAVLLCAMGGFAGLISFLVPFPTPANGGADPAVMSGVRFAMGVFWLTQLAIGIWWVVFFNRPKVKAQFVQPAPAPADAGLLPTAQPLQYTTPGPSVPGTAERPLSISIVAWLLLVGCLFIPLSFFLHAPAVLFTKLLTGWPAILFFLSFAVMQLFIGIGLLRLNPAARMAAILYFVFGAVNTSVFYIAPGGHARAAALMDSQKSMFPWMRLYQSQTQFVFDPTPFVVVGSLIGVIVAMIPVYFLITRRLAFEKASVKL